MRADVEMVDGALARAGKKSLTSHDDARQRPLRHECTKNSSPRCKRHRKSEPAT